MTNPDIRWIQRFNNYNKALTQLEKAVAKGTYTDLERQGLIKAFEFTYELGWNVMRDFLKDKGYSDVIGSKDTIRLAFNVGLIEDGTGWLEMVSSRNLSSHTYNQETAEEMEADILHRYFFLFKQLQDRMEQERKTYLK